MFDSTPQNKTPFFKTRNGKNALAVLAILVFYPFIHFFIIQQANTGPAPQFEAKFLNGEQFQLKDFDEPLLIRFWATWCEICKHEMPDIEKLSKEYQVINIAIQSGSDSEVSTFAKTHGMDSSNIVNDKHKILETLYNAQAVPASFIVDGSGIITHSKIGYSTYRELSEKLSALKDQ
ncbi:MAG: redoxin domain-containing protein [Thiotrichales bacterium]|nr:redoxin domain-containing protein [Thiotrichales bacterium]